MRTPTRALVKVNPILDLEPSFLLSAKEFVEDSDPSVLHRSLARFSQRTQNGGFAGFQDDGEDVRVISESFDLNRTLVGASQRLRATVTIIAWSRAETRSREQQGVLLAG